MDARRIRAALVLALALAGCGRVPRETPPEPTGLNVAEALRGSGVDGFERAATPLAFEFPRDHGPHPRFRTEWWYFTGNLLDLEGRHFGFQATFFRNGLAAIAAERASGWATHEIYMAHFALTDSSGERYYSFERFGRGAAGIAGAGAEPLRIWLEDWEVAQVLEEVPATYENSANKGSLEGPPGVPGTYSEVPATSRPRWRLWLSEGDVAMDLVLETRKPPVFHGDQGLSQKGSQPGNASYYYSYTRLLSSGTIRVGDRELAVEGLSWMDHEWSTSVLEEGQVGWNWVSLQFPDQTELMYFELRNANGESDNSSGTSGTWIGPDGSHEPLAPGDARLTTLDTWTSPDTSISYPSRWRLTVDSRDLELEFEPTLPQQEHTGTFTYWEGAVRGALEDSEKEPRTFRGYVELTGYGDRGAERGDRPSSLWQR